MGEIEANVADIFADIFCQRILDCIFWKMTAKYLNIFLENDGIFCQSNIRLLTLTLPQLLTLRWGPYLQSCQWGFNMGKLKLSQISHPVVQCENRSLHTLFQL